jgi:hypothetical protein
VSQKSQDLLANARAKTDYYRNPLSAAITVSIWPAHMNIGISGSSLLPLKNRKITVALFSFSEPS